MNNEIINNRIWIFIAYKDAGYEVDVPIFSKLFNDHTELKEFSAKHSAEWKDKTVGYNSTYLDLTDKSFISTTQEQALAEYRGKIRTAVAITREPKPSANAHGEYNRGMHDGATLMRNAVVQLLNDNKIEE